MDNRAYHLQPLAHTAVAKALARGALVRMPCGVCGATGQAHHDSYYPDKWLDVRWLCGSHHMQWHAANEPVWPTIFEFHPSDASRQLSKTVRVRPWFRTQTQAWYVTWDGKAVWLGKDRGEASSVFEKMKAERETLLARV